MKNIGLAKETSLLFVVKVCGAVFSFVVQILINRLLGTSVYGQLSTYLAVAAVMINLLNLGTNIGMVKKIATSSSNRNDKKYIQYSLNISIAVTILFLLVSIIGYQQIIGLFSGNGLIMAMIILYSFSFAISNMFTGYLQGKKRTLFANVIDIVIYNLLLIGGALIASIIKKSVNTLLVAYLFTNILVLIYKIIVINKEDNNIFEKWRVLTKEETKENINYAGLCIPFCLSTLCISVQFMVMKIILDSNMGSYDVGIFRILETYVSCMALFVSPFITLWPYMAKAYKEDRMIELKNIYSNSVSVIALLALPTTISMLICCKEVYAIFGLDYSIIPGAFIAFFFMMLAGTIDAIIGPAGALLKMTNYGVANLIITVVFVFFSIGISICIIPKYGLIGAAISTSISRILTNIFTAVFNYLKLKIWPYNFKLFVLLLASLPLYFGGKCLYTAIDSAWVINILTIAVFEIVFFVILFYFLYKDLTSSFVASIKNKVFGR